ncbi:MAG: hypothetical protein DMG27_21005, partial [Acidobacteria bacterium]
LPGGKYGVTAHYAGDGTYGASDSTPAIQVTVSKEDSKTQLGIVTFDPSTGLVANTNATTFAYGSPYILRADVTNAAGTMCAPAPLGESACPTGAVTVTDNGQQLDLGNYALNSAGYTEDQPIQLPAGSHSLVAAYALGDNSFNPSTSSPDAVTVTQALTSARIVPAPTSAVSGTPFDIGAVVNTLSNGAAPSGTVQFFSASTQVGSAVSCVGTGGSMTGLAACQATTSLTLTAKSAATLSVTAQYSGDSNYVASTSPAVAISVTPPPPDFSLSATPSSSTVTAGGSAASTISVAGANGFASAVALTCAVTTLVQVQAQYMPTCAFSPSSVTPGQNPATSKLTIGTSARAVTPPATFTPGGPRQIGPPLRGVDLRRPDRASSWVRRRHTRRRGSTPAHRRCELRRRGRQHRAAAADRNDRRPVHRNHNGRLRQSLPYCEALADRPIAAAGVLPFAAKALWRLNPRWLRVWCPGHRRLLGGQALRIDAHRSDRG